MEPSIQLRTCATRCGFRRIRPPLASEEYYRIFLRGASGTNQDCGKMPAMRIAEQPTRVVVIRKKTRWQRPSPLCWNEGFTEASSHDGSSNRHGILPIQICLRIGPQQGENTRLPRTHVASPWKPKEQSGKEHCKEGVRDKSGSYGVREAQKSSNRPERMQQRKARMALAPRTDQRMPDCLRRSPMTVRQPASTTPEPMKNFFSR